MATHSVTLITGDGTGPELAEAAQRCLDAALAKTDGAGAIDWTVCEAGVDIMETAGTPMPEETIESVRNTDATLKAPITTPIGTGFRSVNVALRQTLDLYACLRPCKSYPGVRSRYENIDLVIVRENTEDLYAGLEHVVVPGVVESLKIITSRASDRIANFAFRHARDHGRRRVTAVHKANIMKLGDGLFLHSARRAALDYPDVKYDERIVDAACMHLVMKPEQFDMLLLPNLYGDIVSDLCAGFVGGLGLAPGANIGDEAAVFEAVHGSAPDIAGKDLANPGAVILAGVMMLRHLERPEPAGRLERAFRDMYTGTQHAFISEKIYTEAGKLMLGLIEDTPAL